MRCCLLEAMVKRDAGDLRLSLFEKKSNTVISNLDHTNKAQIIGRYIIFSRELSKLLKAEKWKCSERTMMERS